MAGRADWRDRLLLLLTSLLLACRLAAQAGCGAGPAGLAGRLVLVAGAEHGPGYQVALAAAHRGARVLMGCDNAAEVNKPKKNLFCNCNSLSGAGPGRSRHDSVAKRERDGVGDRAGHVSHEVRHQGAAHQYPVNLK